MRLLKHFLHRLLISRRDDIGGPKGLPQFQPLFPVSDEKDAFGPQTFGGEDSTESDCSIANHCHRAACPDPCGDSSMMACRHDIGEGKDGLEQMLVAFNRGGNHHQGPSAYGTRTASPWPPSLGSPQRSPCTHELGKPARQNSHVPSEIKKGEITRSPFLMVRTSAPTSSPIPIHSCPMRSPGAR